MKTKIPLPLLPGRLVLGPRDWRRGSNPVLGNEGQRDVRTL